MILLSKEHIIALYSQLIAETGGTDGIRDENLLDSAINAPFQSYGGTDVFSSIQQKAARMGYGLVQNMHSWMVTNALVRMPCSYFLH
jgi:death-on-curing protein